jgi:tetratricopeptide (TPR) repeat protein
LKLISFLHGIRNTAEIETLRDDLGKTEAVVAEKRTLKRVLDEERSYYIQYADAFVSYRINFEDSMTPVKPNSWWKEQLKIAYGKMQQASSPMDTLLGRRMVDYIWRTARMQYESVQGTEYQPTSRYFLEIWAMVQPDAVSPYYYLARYYTGQGRYEKALKSLEDAIDRGLSDRALIEGDSTLVNLTTLTEYRKLALKLEETQQ